MAFCGAKTRSGHTCKNSAMANGRCRMHGGKSTGVKENQNAKKHGIYAKFITDDEWQAVAKSELDRLDDELRLCKVRLLRALQAENKQGNLGDDALELIRKTIEPPIIGGMPITADDDDDDVAEIVKKSFERQDYNAIIDRLIGRIQSLTVTRQDLVSKSIDIELKQIELDKVKSADEKTQAKPTQIVINVQDGRKDAKTDAKT